MVNGTRYVVRNQFQEIYSALTLSLPVDSRRTHVIDPVWDLYRLARQLTGGASALLDWDANIPEFPVLDAKVLKSRQYMSQKLPSFPATRHEVVWQETDEPTTVPQLAAYMAAEVK